MADREIDLKIVLDDNGAIQTINGVDQAIKKTKDSTEGLNRKTGEASSLWSSFGVALLGVAGTFVSLNGALNLLNNSLTRAREVEDLSAGFDVLSARVGELGSVKIEQLRQATQGLTSDMDLYRLANQAVLLGVDDGSGKFKELTAAAVKLGNTMGITTTSAVESLVVGLGRNSRQMLDNLGIIVDSEGAYQRYADKLGVTVEALTEAEKKTAFLEQGTRDIIQAANGLAPSADTAATAYERLGISAERTKDQFSLGVSSSESLGDALDGLNESLKGIDWKGAGEGFGSFISAIVAGINQLALVNRDLNNLGLVLDLYFENLTNPGSVKEFFAPYETALQEAAALQAKTAALQESLGAAGNTAGGAAKKIEEVGTKSRAAGDSAKKAANDFEKFTEQISEISNTKAGGAFEQISKDATAFGVALATNAISVKDFNEQLALLGKKTGKEGFKVIIDGAKAGEKAVEDITAEVLGLTTKLDKFNEYEEPIEDIFDGFDSGQYDVEAVNDKIEQLILSTGGSVEEMEKLLAVLKKLKEEKPETNTEKYTKGFQEQIGAQLATTITNAVTNALSGAEIGEALGGIGNAAGSAVGTGLGGILGGPEGAAVGQAIGGVIGDEIGKNIAEIGKSTKGSIFGGIDLIFPGIGTALNKTIGSAFGEMSKDEKLRRAFGDGFNQLLETAAIEDILPTDFLNTDGIQEKFDSLDIASNLIPQFDGISAALATTFGLIEDGGDTMLSQFSQILAVNFQNAQGLNDLQIILQRSGLDAETLKQNLEEAYLSGELAAGAFLNATAQVENLYAAGIPGALGATDLAFQNFVNNALSSGAEAKDGIGDLGAEMTEALNGGVSTLAELQERLIAQGADAGKVAQFFEAAAKAGISTIEQLTNVTTAQAANITASLQGVQGFFAETSNQVAELENQLNGLDGKEVNIKVKFSSEFDSSTTQNAIEGGGIGAEGAGAG